MLATKAGSTCDVQSPTPIHPLSEKSPPSAPPPTITYYFLFASTLLSHASCSLSEDSSSVMTVNSSVLPFSWIFSLFMRVTISCSLSWVWELDGNTVAPFPSPPSLDVIIRVCFLPHKLQRHIQTHLFIIDFFCHLSAGKYVDIGKLNIDCHVHNMLHDSSMVVGDWFSTTKTVGLTSDMALTLEPP